MIKIPEKDAIERMPAGGYICRIVKATEGINRYNEPCLLLYLDVAEGDFKNYFGTIYERRLKRGVDRFPCVFNQVVNAFGERYFQRVIGAIERSNAGYFCSCRKGADWDERELEGLLVGVVLREREFRNSHGATRTYLVPAAIKSVEEIRRGEFTVPEKARA